MNLYEGTAVGIAWGLAIASFLRYLASRLTLRSTKKLCSQHRKEMDALFADTTEQIRVNGRETIERIGQYAEETIRNMEAED